MVRAAGAVGVLGLLGALVASGGEARAQERIGPVWSFSLTGGMLAPLGHSATELDTGLVAGGRLGWRAPSGVGVAVAVDYSPLPRPDAGDSHWLAATLTPQLTIGENGLRAVVRGGGGVIVAYRRVSGDGAGSGDVGQSTSVALVGGIGLEAHVLASGGMVIDTEVLRGFGGEAPMLCEVTAGLVFEL